MLLNSSVDGKYEMRSLHVRYRGYRISSRQGAGLGTKVLKYLVTMCHMSNGTQREELEMGLRLES